MIQLLNNERANFAYEAVSTAKKEKYAKEYRSLARSIPAMLQMNGLGATIAFLYSKSSNAHYAKLYESIEKWCQRDHKKEVSKNQEFIKMITELNSEQYRMLTREVMGLLVWIKRFAEGMIDSDKAS